MTITATPNSTIVFPAVTTIQIGSRTYRIGERAMGGFFIRETASGSRVDFYSRKALNHFIDMLKRAAGDIEPEPTPPAAVCQGWQAAHYNLPEELQNAPAVAYIGVRHVCEHCKAAHDRAMAHLAGLQQQAATPAPQYITFAEAA